MSVCLGFSSQGVGLHSSLDLSLSMGMRLCLQVVCMHCHLLRLLSLPLPCTPMHIPCCCYTKQSTALRNRVRPAVPYLQTFAFQIGQNTDSSN